LTGDIKAGFRYRLSQRRFRIILATLFIFGLGNGLGRPLDLLLIKNRQRLDDSSIQWLTMTIGAGMIAGGLLSSITTKLGDFREKMMLAFSVMSLSVAGNCLS
jgi:MFS transporter, DHA3 family, macrolide efflux protein